MTDRELMQMAFDSLRLCTALPTWPSIIPTIEALRTALAQPEPEPVAVVQQEAYGRGQVLWVRPVSEFADGTLLYTAPPKKEWVGLTDKEMCDIRGRVQEYTPIDAVEYGKVLQLFTAEALEDKNK